jgi:hypothetical protein
MRNEDEKIRINFLTIRNIRLLGVLFIGGGREPIYKLNGLVSHKKNK